MAKVKCIFFRKYDFFLQKIVKNINKIIKIFFLSKKYTLVPKLSYMFYKKLLIKYNIILKKLFPFFSQISKSPWDSGDGDVDGDGENFNIENFSENEMT